MQAGRTRSAGKSGGFPGTMPATLTSWHNSSWPWKIFLERFAVESGWIGREEAGTILEAVRGHLVALCGDQARSREEARAGEVLEYLRSAISAHHGHREPMQTAMPTLVPSDCGWREDTIYVVAISPPRPGGCRRGSKRVGYVDENNKLACSIPSRPDRRRPGWPGP